jgi:hypothetical protein
MTNQKGIHGDFGDSSDEEWIDLERLREVINEIEMLGGTKITPVDLLNRLGIEDEELDLLKQVRRIRAASPGREFLPGADEPWAPGRRKAKPANH